MTFLDNLIKKGRELFSSERIESDLDLCRSRLSYHHSLYKSLEGELNGLHQYYSEVEDRYNLNRITLNKAHGIDETLSEGKNYACILFTTDGGEQILLLKRSSQDEFCPGKWNLPGGSIDPGETPREAALREFTEETGIDHNPEDFYGRLTLAHKADIEGGSIFYYFYYPSFEIRDRILNEIRVNREHENYAFVSLGQWHDYDTLLDLNAHLDEIFAPKAFTEPIIKSMNGKFESFELSHFEEVRNTSAQLEKAKQAYTHSFSEYLSYLAKGDIYTNLRYNEYLNSSLGKRRKDMPQIDADHIDDWLIHFSGKGNKVTKEQMTVADLKMSQGEIDTGKVLDMLQTGSLNARKFLVSKDNYLVDGHHQFCAQLEIDPSEQVTVYKVNLPIKELLRRSNLLKIARKEDINGDSLSKYLDKGEDKQYQELVKAWFAEDRSEAINKEQQKQS